MLIKSNSKFSNDYHDNCGKSESGLNYNLSKIFLAMTSTVILETKLLSEFN